MSGCSVRDRGRWAIVATVVYVRATVDSMSGGGVEACGAKSSEVSAAGGLDQACSISW